MLTPEELARNEQLGALFRNRAAGGVPRRMPDAEIEQLIQAAAIIGGGRAEGLEDGETIQRFVRQLVNENDRRAGGATARANNAEAVLKAAGLAPDDLEAKNAQEMLRDEAEFGFAYDDDAMKVIDGDQRADDIGDLRAELREAKNIRNKRARAKAVKAIQRDLDFQVEKQKNFDFGLSPLKNEGGGRPETVIKATTPRDIKFGPRNFEGEPLDFGQELQGKRVGTFQVGLKGPVDVIPDQGGYIEFGADARERGRFVQRGAEIYTDSQGIRRVGKPGEVAFEQGGGFIEGPNGPIQLPGRQVKAERDEQGRAVLPKQGDLRMNQDTPVGLGNAELRRLNEQDRAMGQSAVREFERYERGDLTPSEMANRARLEAARATNEVFIRDGEGGFEPNRAAAPVEVYKDERGVVRGMPRANAKARDIKAHSFNGVSADEAQSAILGQLQARKEANRAGRRERIQAMNMLDAVDEANQLLVENRMPGQNVRADIKVLGQLKGDKLKRDMGLELGSQRVDRENAIRVERPDGSYEFIDRAGNPLAQPSVKTSQAINIAEHLNAPQGANNAVDFVLKNQFEDRGAQFFGDEAVLAQMNDKGAGGGIEQVDIGGALRGIEQKVADRLGIDPKRIGGVKGFQNAMNAVIEDERRRGNALIRLEDGEKVRVSNPGVEEALLALKVQPAEARQIANALKQKELAEFDRFDPRVAVDSAVQPGPNPANVFGGLDDPKRGGDRLALGKDVRFQGKAQAAVDGLSPTARKEFDKDIELAGGRDVDAGKPFVGRVEGERAFGGFNNVLARDGKAMDPVDVRLAQEERVRQNREKKVANMAKKGKKIKFGIEDDRADVAKIRQMQEGNVFAQIRANRAQAQAENAIRNDRGVVRAGRGVNVPGDFAEPRVGYKKVIPGVKRVGNQELLPRPVLPRDPNVVDAGEGFRNVQVPEGYTPRSSEPDVANRIKDFATNPKYQRGRRIAYGAGGGLAALATILNMGDDEEQEQI